MKIIYFISFLYSIILTIGVILAFYYIYLEKGITDKNEFIHLLFFPLSGFGNWKYNSLVRNNEPIPHSKNWYVYNNMIRINWFIIAALLMYEVYTFYHLYQFLLHYNEFKNGVSSTIGSTTSDILYSLFGWMINWSINIAIAFMAFILLISFLACFMMLIIIPKLLSKNK